MAKFKVGDKVRRIRCGNIDRKGNIINTGDVLYVAEVTPEGWLLFDGFTGPNNTFFFELVEAAPEPAPVQHVSSRSNDPATSKAAGKVKRVSLREQLAIDFSVCGDHGLTGHEAALRLGGYHKLNSVTPRFAELRREGKIKDSGHRRDKQIVWVLA